MGLPLFVAPVESNLPSKAASKGNTTSPSRSGIRRLSRPESRDRRSSGRTADLIYTAARQRLSAVPSLPRPNQDDGHWSESSSLGLRGQAEPRPRSSVPEIRQARQSPWPEFQEQLATLFANWREQNLTETTSPPESEPRNADDRPWPTESRPAGARRARVVAPLPPRFDRSPDRLRPYHRSQPLNERLWRMNGVASSTQPITSHVNRGGGPRYSSQVLRSVPDMPSQAARHGPGIDGLGDRDRSLSPEVWDTLLSTLTPDPQPPSAGSSFASATGSQSVGPSSSTFTMAPDAAADAQCDSGCDSDQDMDEDEQNMRRRGPQPGDGGWHSRRFGLDGAADSSAGPSAGLRGASRGPMQRAADGFSFRTNSGRNTAADTGGVDNGGEARRGMPLARLLNRTEEWAGQGSGEASEEEMGSDGRRQGAEASGGAGRSAGLGREEDLSGMQRIVRSLARREDIPDEWWAEVGLSRTLGQDDAGHE